MENPLPGHASGTSHLGLVAVLAASGVLASCAGTAGRSATDADTNPALISAAPVYPDKSRLLTYIDEAGNERPVRTIQDWARRRAHILANVQKVMGPLPTVRVPLDVRILETFEDPKFTRKKLTYQSDPANRVAAYLFIPKGISGRVPAILCPHPTNPVLGKRSTAGLIAPEYTNPDSPAQQYWFNSQFAKELAERGYVTITPDYPTMGEAATTDAYALGYESASMKGIWDNMRAIDLLETLPEVDPRRIGCVGHSLGGYNTLFTALFDQRIVAAASGSAFTAFQYTVDSEGSGKVGDLRAWGIDKHMRRIRTVYHNDAKLVPFDFHELVGAMAPRYYFVHAPLQEPTFKVEGVREVLASAQTVYDLYGVPDHLRAIFPDHGHIMLPDEREIVYSWFDQVLRSKPN